ncbi:DUF5063 domain-containing protein [Leptospira meyeri]|nr:DUF5063 domain-containing protein [Leptospira meyeri]
MKNNLIKNLKEIINWSNEFQNLEDKPDILMRQLLEVHSNLYSINYEIDDKEYPNCPERDYQKDYQEIRKNIEINFPEFTPYNVISDITFQSKDNEIYLADPYDDLTDLIIDFKDFVWYLENTSINNGIMYFRNGYTFHWGKHISDLTYYLLHLKFGL